MYVYVIHLKTLLKAASIRSEVSPGIRVQLICIENMSGPILQMLGKMWVISQALEKLHVRISGLVSSRFPMHASYSHVCSFTLIQQEAISKHINGICQ
jgi:hypothetical protein